MSEEERPLSAFESAHAIELRKGDVLLFRCTRRLSDAQREQAVEALNDIFPDHESLILDGGQDIAVLRPEPGLLGRMLAWARRGA